MMPSVTETLTRLYCLLDQVGEPLSPEMVAIRHIYADGDKIKRFHDPELYLQYVKTLINERYNVSFPDDPGLYDIFFADCLELKAQMLKPKLLMVGGRQETVPDSFDTGSYLSYVQKLFAQLKTPYYTVYARTLFAFQECFHTGPIFDKTLQDFYSVMIKSSPDKCNLIAAITDHARAYLPYLRQGCLSESLLAALLIHQLGIILTPFGSVAPLIHDELQKEDQYLKYLEWMSYRADQSGTEHNVYKEDLPGNSSDKTQFIPPASLADYLAKREEVTLLSYNNSEDTGTITGKNERSTYEFRSGSAQAVSSDFLNTYAYNMNLVSYRTNPAICRDQELLDLALILISPKKSPILVGEAGTGKTSIVEGLVWQLQRGLVPPLLKDKRIFKLTTTSLLSGTKYVGEMEERMKKLTDELMSHPEVILFIDEIHTIVGAGSTESSNNDISNMLKPFIDRGDIKVIGATTKKEYDDYMAPDRALSRRFYPIAVEEPDSDMTLEILLGTIPAIEEETRVRNTFSREETLTILKTLIEISHMDNQPALLTTRLPELPLTLLEMAFSYAALYGRDALSLTDLNLAITHSNLLNNSFRQDFEGIDLKK